jgi:hypothetical protein
MYSVHFTPSILLSSETQSQLLTHEHPIVNRLFDEPPHSLDVWLRCWTVEVCLSSAGRQALPPLDLACIVEVASLWADELVRQALMIALGMIMGIMGDESLVEY